MDRDKVENKENTASIQNAEAADAQADEKGSKGNEENPIPAAQCLDEQSEKPAEASAETQKPAGKKRLKITVAATIFLLAVLTALGVGYFQKANYYRTHYFEGTQINGKDFSGMGPEAVAEWLIEEAGEYSIRIMGRDAKGDSTELGIVEAEQISLAPENPLAAANDILDQQNEMWWIETLMGGRYSYSIVQGVEFDERQLRKVLLEMEAFQRRNMTAPTDASIGDFSPETGQYEVIPELKGTWLDADAAVTAVSNAILVHGETVDLEQQACYIEPEVTAQDEELLAALEEANRWVGVEITYDWNGSEVIVDGELIKEWILFEDGKAVLDEEAVAEFVADNARQYDTYGKVRTFRTTAGTELNLGSGAFGWKTDREGETAALMELIREGASVSREPVYAHTAPQKGMNDIGSSYVEADLTHQHLYLYHQGELVLETDFVSGIMSDPSCVTPQGVFGLTYKTTNAVLRGQNYATPVNYWMPFHGNYGMHDATWRSEFGGEIYLTNGSHGCLNLPLDAASQLYQYLYTGYPVICYY